MSHVKKLAGLLLAPLVALSPLVAQAATYPEKPVELIVPVSPGGSLDTLARLLAQELEAELGSTIVVENKPGAGSNIGFEYVAKAKPDGYTLLIAPDSLTINPSLYEKVNYDPAKSFAPVSLVTTAPIILVSRPDLGLKSLADYVAYAKEKGKGFNVASPGIGSAGHLSAALLHLDTGTEWTHAPYKGGGPAITDILGGHVDALWITLAPAVPHVQAGKLTPLAVTTPERSSILPDVPTVAETIPGFDVTNWQGVFAPAGTPPEVVDKLSASIAKIVAKPDVQAKLLELGFTTVGGSPADLAKKVEVNVPKWADIIKKTNIKVE
jgi:tripartite-type tricarboxylate transporter receptor subunit TctC